jgi:flagella basal body P-ring formation protein FlgA
MVANEGRALGNGMEGQVVQIRLNNGQIVSGTVKPDGTIELPF